MLTFLGGPRACIGYRFSLVECVSLYSISLCLRRLTQSARRCRMKALIFTLVRAFEFELAVDPADIKKGGGIVQRPMLRSEPEKGNQMPLLVRRVTRA